MHGLKKEDRAKADAERRECFQEAGQESGIRQVWWKAKVCLPDEPQHDGRHWQ
jgi:hypothetical protein